LFSYDFFCYFFFFFFFFVVCSLKNATGMLRENLQFGYQVRIVERVAAVADGINANSLASSLASTAAAEDDTGGANGDRKKKSRVKRPKGGDGSSSSGPSSRSSSRSSSLKKGALINAAAAASEPVPISKRSRGKGSAADAPATATGESPSSSGTPAVAESPPHDGLKLITLFVPDSKAPRPTPHIVECTQNQRTGELLQQLLATKRVDKKKLEGAWLFEVDEPAGIDRRLGVDERVAELITAWDTAGHIERKLFLKIDKSTAAPRSVKATFRTFTDSLLRVGKTTEETTSSGGSSTSTNSSPQASSSAKSSANSSPSLFAKGRTRSKGYTDAASQGSPIDTMRKELEDANTQIEALELALAVANNKLMRLENQKASVAAANQDAAAALSGGALGAGAAGALSQEARGDAHLPRFRPMVTPISPRSGGGAGAGGFSVGGDASGAGGNNTSGGDGGGGGGSGGDGGDGGDTIGRVRLELTVNIPEFGLEGLIDNYWASPADTVRNIVDRVMGRYGVADPQCFGLRQISGAADRWFDEKVVVAQSQSIMKNRLAVERRKGKPKKISEDLATRIRVLGELLGRKPHPGEVELVVPRSGAGSGAETFAGLPLTRDTIERVCTLLEKRGLDTEGLFRVPGDHNRVRAIWALFASELGTAIDNEPVNNVAGALKLYIRTCKPPLIPPECIARMLMLQHAESVRVAAVIESQSGKSTPRVKSDEVADDPALPPNISKTLMHGMSAHDFAVLSRIIALLARVAARSDENKMTLSNLAVVFGPALVRTDDSSSVQAMRDAARYGNAAVCTMVHYCREIFGPFTTIEAPAINATTPRAAVAASAAEAIAASPVAEPALDAAMDLHLSAASLPKGAADVDDDADDDDNDGDDNDENGGSEQDDASGNDNNDDDDDEGNDSDEDNESK
jgi:hypothetical protein